MNDKLKLLLDKINMNSEYYSYFDGGCIKKIIRNKELRKSCFVLELTSTLPVEVYDILKKGVATSFRDSVTNIILLKVEYKDINYDYLTDYYKYILDDIKGLLPKIFIQNKVYLDNNDIVIEVLNKVEENKISGLMNSIKTSFMYAGFDNELRVVINKEEEELIKKEIESETLELKHNVSTSSDTSSDEDSVVVGSKISGEVNYTIRDMIGEDNNVIVDAYIFGCDPFESPKSNFKILTLKISDNTDSIYCKVFSKDAKEFAKFCSKLKEGKWIRVKGNLKNDPFAKDLVLTANSIEIIPSKDVDIVDNSEVKRVELHAHTMMSQMDGVTKLDLGKHTCELVERAIKMGYKGVAITDHNSCQAFPIAYGIINGYNKKIEDKSKHFKGLYGVELTLVDDTVDIVIRPTDESLDTTFVVFDTETTGFNAGGGDQMIEIGAVKICNGEIVERFDELINPGHHIPNKITELTCISDDMVKDCDNEENVTKRFLEWTGNLPMVAHNAKFDISFIEMSMKKYNLGPFTNTVIDTLELSRALDRDAARHSLSALVKRYNVEFNEDAHHRADYDAEGTAMVFHKMISKLKSQNFEVISELNNLVDKSEIHKFGRTYHFNAIAKNKTGLKNLFKMISLANTVYLYKTPRILRSKVNERSEERR